MWDFSKRKYEDEYMFAKRLGECIGRKMNMGSTRYITITAHRNTYYREWLDGRMFMMHSAHKCFDRELFCGWIGTQGHRLEFKYKWVQHHLRRMVMDDCVVFTDIHGLRPDETRSVIDLEMEINRAAPNI